MSAGGVARISCGEADNALLDTFTHSEQKKKQKHVKCAGQASWTFNDWGKVGGSHCHRGVSADREPGGSVGFDLVCLLCGNYSHNMLVLRAG